MKRKRKLDRSVTCRVRLCVGGRPVKTVKRLLSVAQAVRELGRDPLCAEGRLMSGEPITMRRTVTPAVRVEITYTCDHRPADLMSAVRLDTAAAVEIVRGGMVL